jgi:hypothetical protein
MSVIEALEERLKVLEDEILRVTKLAAEAAEQIQQDSYWGLAQDLQREARELRREIEGISQSARGDSSSTPAVEKARPSKQHRCTLKVMP